jgi:hypothetical protein
MSQDIGSLTWLLGCVLAEAGTRCSTATSRDLETIMRRVEYEGLSFLTITLPSFAKEFERALEQTRVEQSNFPGFRKKGRYLPAFLQGFTSRVFNINNGGLRDVPDIEAIKCIRQLCLMYKKLLVPCSDYRLRRAIGAFVRTEDEISSVLSTPAEGLDHAFTRASALIWSRVLGDLSFGLQDLGSACQHGPGATADRVRNNSKWRFAYWHERVQTYFPMDDCAAVNAGLFDHGEGGPTFRSEDEEQPVRVVFVPKTLKSPRVIAMEPVVMQYAQQALKAEITQRLEANRVTAGRINFSDQSINRRLALDSSRNGKYATLDLSEASDRVLHALVFHMLSSVPDLRDAIFACRSTNAELPDGKVIRLSKFASMGSALCFPIEAMVFFTIIVAQRLHRRSSSMTANTLRDSDLEGIYVYGDDIIVPVDEVEDVMYALSRYGLKVNSDKSFWNGKFRESCGMDAYDGVPVTPVYFRREFPRDIRSSSELISLVAFHNQMIKSGWIDTCEAITRFVKRMGITLPFVEETSPSIGWHCPMGRVSKGRWNKDLHRMEIRGFVPTPVFFSDPLDGVAALLKCLKSSVGKTDIDPLHLQRSVRSGTVSIKRRWVPAS